MTTVQIESVEPITLKLPSGQIVSVQSEVSIKSNEIPIIDVSVIWSNDLNAKKEVAEKVREASHRISFFYAQNHGVDTKYAAEAFKQSQRFCSLLLERKLEVDTALVPNEYVGYHKMKSYNRNGRKRKDLHEAFNWAYDATYDPEAVDKSEESISIWPSNLPGFKEGLCAYHTQLLQFARQITRIFALALHMPKGYFDDYVKRPEAGMRFVHYPKQQASPADQNGIGAHTDFQCFTLVTQDDCGGLEVLNKQGHWIKASPVPSSFVVNMADCFMHQTNDFSVSTVHRVINKSGRERHSPPFFFLALIGVKCWRLYQHVSVMIVQ